MKPVRLPSGSRGQYGTPIQGVSLQLEARAKREIVKGLNPKTILPVWTASMFRWGVPRNTLGILTDVLDGSNSYGLGQRVYMFAFVAEQKVPSTSKKAERYELVGQQPPQDPRPTWGTSRFWTPPR